MLATLVTIAAAAAADKPSQPIPLSSEEASKQGTALVAEMLAQKPAENFTNSGVLSIRRGNSITKIPVKFFTLVTSSNWTSNYGLYFGYSAKITSITHSPGQTNFYSQRDIATDVMPLKQPLPSPILNIWVSFGDSDFWIADLGLEFLQWPNQRLTKKEMRRSRSCKVLESSNPNPSKGAYSKVISWIDSESDGIVMAQAYDAQGKLLKEFFPKHFSKVNGQWQVEEIEIDNDQTDSSTRVDFDLDPQK